MTHWLQIEAPASLHNASCVIGALHFAERDLVAIPRRCSVATGSKDQDHALRTDGPDAPT
jgi:hypothetical protein